MTLLVYFFQAFEACCAERSLKQKEIAEIIGISENDLSRYKNAKRGMKEDLKAKVANYFGYELLDFLILGRNVLEGKAIDAVAHTKIEIQSDREMELLRKLEVANDEARKWRLQAEKMEKGRLSPSLNTDAMGTAFGVEPQDGLNTTESTRTQT